MDVTFDEYCVFRCESLSRIAQKQMKYGTLHSSWRLRHKVERRYRDYYYGTAYAYRMYISEETREPW